METIFSDNIQNEKFKYVVENTILEVNRGNAVEENVKEEE